MTIGHLVNVGKTNPIQSQYKPNSNPIQSQYKPKTNPNKPKQTQTNPTIFVYVSGIFQACGIHYTPYKYAIDLLWVCW